jgi:hypothetical protein
MELDDEDQFDAMPMPVTMAKPQFPYGMRLCLTDKEFSKMECDPDELKVGDLIHLTECFARVTNKSENDGEMGKTCRVELQIEHCDIEDETTEDE